MIKVDNVGMIPNSKNDPTITSASDVSNYSFITDSGITYLVMQTGNGDYRYQEDLVITAGDPLNCFQVDEWSGQKLFVDGKHVTGGVGSLEVDAVLVVAEDGTLAAGTAPTSGVYFKVTDIGLTLTEAAIKVRVCVV